MSHHFESARCKKCKEPVCFMRICFQLNSMVLYLWNVRRNDILQRTQALVSAATHFRQQNLMPRCLEKWRLTTVVMRHRVNFFPSAPVKHLNNMQPHITAEDQIQMTPSATMKVYQALHRPLGNMDPGRKVSQNVGVSFLHRTKMPTHWKIVSGEIWSQEYYPKTFLVAICTHRYANITYCFISDSQ